MAETLQEAIDYNEETYADIDGAGPGELNKRGRATCGHCGLSFPDVFPSARCPYEAWHEDETTRLPGPVEIIAAMSFVAEPLGEAMAQEILDKLEAFGYEITSADD